MQPNLTLTKHFTQRRIERVGNWPTAEAVRHFLEQSVKVQRCEDMVRLDGKHYRVLAIYWHAELDLIMKVDTLENTAVTVFSRNTSTKRVLEEIGEAQDDFPRDEKRDGLAERIARVRAMFGANWKKNGRQACQA
ncbi:MAG: hypothetical protein M0036_20670 [Desulfobacteraceae bacterium]|nr:hypothetical protein [Desulfobacteraceae bacterium]